MRILVTGGAGFIASHIAERFIGLGHEVTVLDNLSTGRRENVPSGARLVEMDLSSPDLPGFVADLKPEIVDHHAAHADVHQSMTDPAHDARVNVVGTLGLVHASYEAGVRKFILASTGGAIYGDPDVVPCDESHPVQPLSPYGASKVADEVYLATYNRVYGMEYTILRYANIYGPRQHPYTEEGQVVALFARLMLEGRQPTIFGDGEQGRDFVYVGDVVDANVRALDGGSGRTYNVGTGSLLTVNDLYRRLAAITGYPEPPKYAPARPGEVFRIALDASRLRTELGWEPKTTLDTGLAATVDWIRETAAEPKR
jgi:UDP-glucose 4-epimerase